VRNGNLIIGEKGHEITGTATVTLVGMHSAKQLPSVGSKMIAV